MSESEGQTIERRKNLIAWVSLGISLVALGLKYAAWSVSGSIALKSDALETVINVAAAIGGLWAIHLAERPADDNHTYGHYKAEYLSAIIESAMVLVTALLIARESYEGFVHPRMLALRGPGLP